MASSKLIIRNYKGCINSDSTSIIFLNYTNGGKSTLLSTGEKIPVEYWDSNRCEAKKSFRGYSTLNMVIQKFKEKVDTLVREAKLKDIEPTCDYIKTQLRQKKEPKVKTPTLFEFVVQYMEEQKALKNIFTIRSYNNTLNHLKAYSNYIEKELSYNDIDLEFYDSFLSYLFKKKNLSNNGAGNQIKRLKLFMGVALERGYHNNLSFRNRRFKVLSETADTISLSEQELEKLYSYDFSYDKKLERTRDLFFIGCWTALRYSDLSKLTAANIQNGNIVCNTKKTDERVVIPIYETVQTILNKYLLETGEPFPRAYKGEQKYNLHLKTIGRIAGIDQLVKIRVSRGGKVFQEVYKKYELLSSHCARRSAATNLYKMGVPSIVIMRITGHRTERNFLRYIKISQENAADMLKEFWSKRNTPAPLPEKKSPINENICWN
jgi:integrase